MRERLAGELRVAMKARDPVATATVRGLLSALDNKSAIAVTAPRVPTFSRSAEAPRHEPSWTEIEALFAAELEERRAAEADYAARGLEQQAERLRAEMAAIERLWPEVPGAAD
jgi:uncharacterized protein YqeY